MNPKQIWWKVMNFGIYQRWSSFPDKEIIQWRWKFLHIFQWEMGCPEEMTYINWKSIWESPGRSQDEVLRKICHTKTRVHTQFVNAINRQTKKRNGIVAGSLWGTTTDYYYYRIREERKNKNKPKTYSNLLLRFKKKWSKIWQVK